MKNLTLIFCCSIMLFACKKRVDKNISSTESRMEGSWKVDKIKVEISDSMGKLISSSELKDQGSVTFERTTDDANDLAKSTYFSGGCANSDLVGYFKSLGAAVPEANGDYSLYWDADPDDKRVQFWGIALMASYHTVVNIDYSGSGKNKQTLFYVKIDASATNQRYFYTWELTKE